MPLLSPGCAGAPAVFKLPDPPPMFIPLSSYHPDNQPLGHFKTYPIYLATVLVAVQ